MTPWESEGGRHLQQLRCGERGKPGQSGKLLQGAASTPSHCPRSLIAQGRTSPDPPLTSPRLLVLPRPEAPSPLSTHLPSAHPPVVSFACFGGVQLRL